MKRIVVTGPESTGKSTLCSYLASHFKCSWVPEYARTFLEEHNNNYSYDDLLTIAKGQIALEEEYIASCKNDPFLFIDTDMYVMKVWCEFVYGRCHTWILDQIAQRKYDRYLLCNLDLPWTEEPMREYPDLATRQQLFHLYKDILVNQATPWTEIYGTGDQRFERALAIIADIK